MRPGIALLRSLEMEKYTFAMVIENLGACCEKYGEDVLWPEESRCPYRVECLTRSEGLIYLEIKPTKKKGGKMSAISRLYFTVRDAAKILDCRQSHVLKLIRSKELNAEKHGWVWAIAARDLEEYQKKQKN